MADFTYPNQPTTYIDYLKGSLPESYVPQTDAEKARQRLQGFAQGSYGAEVPGGEGRRSIQAFEQFQRYRGQFLQDQSAQLAQVYQNPFLQAAAKQAFGARGDVLGQLGQLRSDQAGALSRLRTGLLGSALGSTLGSQVAAADAARSAGGGRGGLAFGGGAAAFAARGATAAASGQGAALAQALSGAAGAELQAAGQAAQLGTQGLLGAAGVAAGFGQALGSQEFASRTAGLGALAGFSQDALRLAFRPNAQGSGLAGVLGGVNSASGLLGAFSNAYKALG